jgi:hypothetical protein
MDSVYQAMIVRAFHLSIINNNQYTYLMKQMNVKGLRKKEPLDDILTVLQPILIGKAIEMLLHYNVLKPREIIEAGAFMLSQEIVEYLLNLKKGTLNETAEKDNVESFLQFKGLEERKSFK